MAYSAPSELISVGGCPPPVSPEVIHIAPQIVVPLLKSFQDLLSFDQCPNH